MVRTNSESDSDDFEMSEYFLDIEFKWSREFQKLQFGPPIKHVHDPLDYAQDIHMSFVKKYFTCKGEKVLFVGMSPGPWGMAQTGVPFTDARTIKNWFGIRGKIKWFKQILPNRVVTGLHCGKVDESGRKFWDLIRQLCDKPDKFFRHCFIHNYCPLAFYTESGKVISLPEIKGYNQEIFDVCDSAIADLIVRLKVKTVVALGKFVERRITEALQSRDINDVKVGYIPHPSSSNPKHKINWEFTAIQRLKDLGVYRLITQP